LSEFTIILWLIRTMSAYFRNIRQGIKTTMKGMRITFRHFWNARHSRINHNITDSNYFEKENGIATLQYPHAKMPVPDNGRYQLDCEIDDCIVCDKCAKICPVDCIEIDAIKSPEVINYTSDGSPVRLYAAKFDIDMAKCCFCGLCTTVCPTECLTMSNEYDFSVVDITKMNFQFSSLSPEQAERKRELYKQYVAEKEVLKSNGVAQPVKLPEIQKPSKPTFKPSFKPKTEVTETIEAKEEPKAKPVFKPSFKPKTEVVEKVEIKEESKAKPVFKPTFKPTFNTNNNISTTQPNNIVVVNKPINKEENVVSKAKPIFKPKMKITPKTD
jgi:formate hydrogenlyase subunit 6/NADH:ubiquinone oxidoreductase subunit I